MSHAQSLLFLCLISSAHSTRTPNPTSLLFPSHGDDHCDDPRDGATFGQLAESHVPTGYEPWSEQHRGHTDVVPQTKRDVDVWFCESIATPPLESVLDDEQIRNVLAWPLYIQEREKQVQTDHNFITPTEKTLCQVHLVPEQVRGDLLRCSHTRRKSSQESHLDRDGFPLAHRAVQGEIESPSRHSESENDTRLILEQERDHPLSEVRSEVLKQENRADFLDCAIRELRRQIHSSRMETDHTNLGYETSRREQARLHEESAQRGKALRETLHEVEELKRAQEMRIDEFSRQELRENQGTIRELTSQMLEWQARVNLMNVFREIQDFESACSGRLSRVPSQPAVVPSPCGMLSRDHSLRPDTWNLLDTSGNVVDNPLAPINSSSTPYRGLQKWGTK